MQHKTPTHIEVIGAKVNNLKNISLQLPLNRFIAISGLSGSGKSSLAMDVLYAEGSRRYLEALSAYTRRRISQEGKPNVEEIKFLPAAIALRQRPQIPNARSTVGTVTETYNILRLIFSRLGSHVSPSGVRVLPTLDVAKALPIKAADGTTFRPPEAEDFSFNAGGACDVCHGLGKLRQINEEKLIPNENLSIDQGAVASWGLPGRNFMKYVAVAMGIDIYKPYKELSPSEKNQILHGEKKPYSINIPTTTGRVFQMENALFENAYLSVEDSYQSTKNENTIKRLNRFYSFDTCPSCYGSRLNAHALQTLVAGVNIAEVSDTEIKDLSVFAQATLDYLPEDMKTLGKTLLDELNRNILPLLQLGVGYLTLSRSAETLSTGELQRIQLSKTIKNTTTGILYVLDEPSIGLHPANVEGLLTIFQDLLLLGNSLVVVDHNTILIAQSELIVEMGPGAGKNGGTVLNVASPQEIINQKNSLIGPFLSGKASLMIRKTADENTLFDQGRIALGISTLHNLKDVQVEFPIGRYTCVTGFSGSGKSSLIMEGLVPAMNASIKKEALPAYITSFKNEKIKRVVYIDAVPIGKNTRSTIATFSGIFDKIRNLFATTAQAKEKKWGQDYFSYNTPKGACEACKGTGIVNLDVQYLPDIEEVCSVCDGKRYKNEILTIKWEDYSVADILDLPVSEAVTIFQKVDAISPVIHLLNEMGLGYLKLGEATPTLSGGEAQRLKLVAEMGKTQKETLFVFDEPSVGLHPLDIHTLLTIFEGLIQKGATIIDIEHDLNMIANADYIIDIGPKGGKEGGKILATETPKQLALNKDSITGEYLKKHFDLFRVSI